MMNINLLGETLEELEHLGYTKDDIEAVGLEGIGYIPEWETAFDFEYDAGFGSQHVHPLLVIRFRDGSWLERAEYDGSENWVYKSCPQVPDIAVEGRKLCRY